MRTQVIKIDTGCGLLNTQLPASQASAIATLTSFDALKYCPLAWTTTPIGEVLLSFNWTEKPGSAPLENTKVAASGCMLLSTRTEITWVLGILLAMTTGTTEPSSAISGTFNKTLLLFAGAPALRYFRTSATLRASNPFLFQSEANAEIGRSKTPNPVAIHVPAKLRNCRRCARIRRLWLSDGSRAGTGFCGGISCPIAKSVTKRVRYRL